MVKMHVETCEQEREKKDKNRTRVNLDGTMRERGVVESVVTFEVTIKGRVADG